MNVSPTVSVLIVNLNGRHLLDECLASLIAQDYPADKVEIVVVDNGSIDDSVAYLHERYPAVKVIEAGSNRGFAGGNNLAAAAATGDYLALINNDARADPQWLRALVTALDEDPQVACASSLILNQDGRQIDFVGSVMNPYGRAFQLDEGLPLHQTALRTAHDLLAPCGGAMIIRREVYRAVGGFDEDYIAYYEDLDLGWRLWLYGYRVVFAPDAIVYHRQHQTGIGFPVEKRYAQSEMNALRTVIKNYDDTNFMRMLSLSLFLAVRRSLDQVGLNREEYRLGQPPQNNGMPDQVVAASPMSRVATAILVAVDRVAEEMPQLLAKRQRIQAARVRSDAEIFARFPMRSDNPVFPWRQYTVVHDELAQALGVPAVLQPHHGSRLLIITHETIGPLMAGPGIRAWEMARALARHADITLAAPGSPQREQPGLRVVGYDPQDLHLQALAPHLASADVVLAMGPLFARYRRLQDLGKPTIVDLYDPFELEKLAQAESAPAQPRPGIDQDSRLSLQLEGAAGDFFLCASERQRDLWLGTLLASGRVNTVTYGQDPTLRNLIDVVPFGISEEAPRHDRNVLKGIVPGIAEDDRVLLWNGGLWQWLDPLTLIDAMPRVLAERGDVKLYFAAGKHFDTDTVSEMPVYGQVRERSRELGLLDRHVFFGNWIPYDARGAYLLEADLAVSLHRPGLESRFASRTRLLDCIWAGLPVVAAEGDPIGETIGAHELGFLVPPGQPDVLAKVILAALGDQNLRERTAARSLALRSELAWDHCVQPIVSFLGRAAFAPDALRAAKAAAQASNLQRTLDDLARANQALDRRIDELQAHLDAIANGRVMRLMNGVQKAFGKK